MDKKMYKVIKDLPTGVRTEISDKLRGTVNVFFKVREPFNLKI